MIEDERRSELENALEVLTRHNLCRRGYCDMQAAEVDPKEIGIAIDTAAGCILEYLQLKVMFDEALKKIAVSKGEVRILEHEIKCANNTIDRIADRKNAIEAENKRLKALLASHKIKYKA